MTDAGAVEQDVWSRLLVEVPAFLALPRGSNPETDRQLLDTVKDETNNPNYNGSSTLDMAGIGSDFGIVLDELVEGHQFLSAYVVRDSKKSPKHLTITGTTSNKAVVATVTDSGRSSPAPATGAVTRGRMNRSGKTIGTVGLSNLGNTCYMNSALQCLRNVEELTKYFLAGQAENELNTENPLGKGGHIAMVYNSLLKEIYKDQVPSSVAPRQFKNTFGRYFGSFSGYGQQDSQEFLGILLDALQEDLNRIKKKPYIEKPDSTDEMVNDPKALAKMADQVWDISKKRDDSVIGDLFAGMYKSTLVCPECAKVSITFDPFNTVTLQLPIENTWSHELRFFPLNGKPYKIVVDMDKHGSIKTLKEFVSQRTRVPTERLFLAETFKDHFYKFYEDMKPVSEEITKEDMVNIYELERAPTNWPPRNVKNRSLSSPSQEDEQEQYNLIPVLQRKEQAKSSYNHNYTWTLQPFFIVLSPEESCNEEAVRRKVLEQVINQTTFHWEESDSGESNDDSLDQDVVVTTGSDASSGDGKVIATSVDGEDDVVDVSMKERTAQDSSETMTDIQERKRKFHSKRPRWVTDLKAPVNFDAYTDLFELGYFKGSGEEVVPVGWSMSPDQEPMKLSSRYVRRPDPVTVNVRKGSLESDIESDDSPKELPELAATRMNDESSEEDSAPSHTNVCILHTIPKQLLTSFRFCRFARLLIAQFLK
jgi:ubiquitin carboxyl-terminal hydrolase 4/11/15